MKEHCKFGKMLWISVVVLILACTFGNALAQGGGEVVGAGLWCKAVLQTPNVGPVTLKWKEAGSDTTPSGDKVISGYFYADPKDFAYGSLYNPEVFVKVYIASNGWANIAFNHVTVDNVQIFSAHQYAGYADHTGLITLNDRLGEHTYNGVSVQETVGYDGTYTGNAVSPESGCSGAILTIHVSNYIITGTAKDDYGQVFDVTGVVSADGAIQAGIAVGSDAIAEYNGKIEGNSASGKWEEKIYGCSGTWSAAKK